MTAAATTPEDEAQADLVAFWRCAYCYEGAASREEARALMKRTWYRDYERARKNPRMVQALIFVGDMYAARYGWDKAADGSPETST